MNFNVNYEYYRIFYYVARYNSFTKAANVLGSNQPNVTRSMNKLEEALGCRLFVRSNRGVTLTPEGQQLFLHVEIAQNQLQKGEEELAGATTLQTGSITIGASEIALSVYLLDKMQDFHTKYPGIRLKISNHSIPQAMAALHRGTVDFVVVSSPTKVDKTVKETVLTDFDEILVGGRNFAHLTRQKLTFRELAQYPLIIQEQGSMSYDFYNQLFLDHGVIMRPDTEVSTASQILQLAVHNLGLGFLPVPLARSALEQGDIYHIELATPLPHRHISYLKDRRKSLSIAAREFEKTLLAP